ncbi:MAG TPA: zf-HC2 domain-containing protein [Opitutaceae bacterium]|jgi:hypothetical protein
MNCEKFQNTLHEYLDQDLDTGAMAAANRHISLCPACRSAVARERALAQALHHSLSEAAEGLSMPMGARQGIISALHAGPSPAASWLRDPAAPAFRGLAAAAAVLLTAGLFLALEGSRLRPAKRALPGKQLNHTSYTWTVDVSTGAPRHVFELRGGTVVDSIAEDDDGAHAGFVADPGAQN